MKKALPVVLLLLTLFTIVGVSSVFAGTLATESGDWAYPNAPTFTAVLGTNTVTGNLGPTPNDGQDPFNVNIPSTMKVTSVSYSGPAGPHNLVGCGLTGTEILNQSFSSNNSSCQLSWFINTNFATSASPWTVTIIVEAVQSPPPPPSDTTAPAWSVANVTKEATSASGAVVNYTATASDAVGVTSSNCTPASGSTFAIGSTAVNCTAQDAAGNVGNASFNVTVQDTTAPAWSVVNVTKEATSASGAVVNYTATASDAVGVTSSNCTPASGSTFAIGSTAVNCTAQDAAGNVGNASFNVTVQDTTAPAWSVVNVTKEATSASGAVVNYTATPSDAVGVTSSSCTPASGSTFAIGTTVVNCTAQDAAGNVGNASFNVTVQDTTAPAWSVVNVTKEATSASGAVVNYTATPSDAVGVTSSSCTPASGSTFAIGTTAVNCTAQDAAGNSWQRFV